eukprot:c16449_g2_i1 orf=118-279(+)
MWVRVKATNELFTVVNIYALNTSGEREDLWQWMLEVMDEGKYIIMGDFNMIEQ